jgi:ubiquinone biosynthesis protein
MVQMFPLRLLRQPYQDVVRLRRIAEILIKNGLGVLLEQFGLNRLLAPQRPRAVRPDARAARLTMPERLRRTLEELGPTYVKLGQLFSTRPDIVPAPYLIELGKLLDSVPPFPAEIAVQQIELELGQPIKALFASFDPEPLAAASIGQVHRATLLDGQPVVVKVQRPGIRQVIESDFGLLLRQARFLEGHSAILRNYQLAELLEEFRLGVLDELDYVREGNNADRLRRLLRGDGRVVIPRIYWEMTTHHVITMEEVQGVKLAEFEKLRAEGHDLAATAKTVADIYLQQIFFAGVFHADPHPANLLVHGNKISLVDFGLVGFLSPMMKESLSQLLIALMNQEVEQISDLVLHIGAVGGAVDERELQKDIRRMLQRYYGVSLENMSIADFLEEMMTVALHHHIRLPSDLALLARTLGILEGVVLQLDPKFNFVEFAKPVVGRMMREQLSWQHLGKEALETLDGVGRLARTLPRRSNALLEKLEKSEFTLGVDIRRLDRVMRKMDAIANRLAFSVVTAALIIGSALIIQSGIESSVWYLPIVGWGLPVGRIVFVIAGILGASLLVSIARSRG